MPSVKIEKGFVACKQQSIDSICTLYIDIDSSNNLVYIDSNKYTKHKISDFCTTMYNTNVRQCDCRI